MDRLKTNINPKPTKAQSSFAAMRMYFVKIKLVSHLKLKKIFIIK